MLRFKVYTDRIGGDVIIFVSGRKMVRCNASHRRSSASTSSWYLHLAQRGQIIITLNKICNKN